ncbi:MAG: dephospho-CoA kinase [Chlamydiales bacterium]|nr:dephospho-CoA kinase [Chlamydiia bacterium]MCP5507765.1 dephospho-CoA kinase [Chlamydiales bacterium]
MLKLKKIAVTGGISCGKTLFCRYLQELGAYVVSADEVVHQLLSPKTELGQNVIKLLGTDILVDTVIDRRKIAEKVFHQPELLKSLESLLHPEVMREIDKQYQDVSKNNVTTVFVAEIPLLFEIGAGSMFDQTVTVIANEEDCIHRFRNTTGYDTEEFHRRMSRQFDPQKKAQLADSVIPNTGSKKELQERATQFYQHLLTH